MLSCYIGITVVSGGRKKYEMPKAPSVASLAFRKPRNVTLAQRSSADPSALSSEVGPLKGQTLRLNRAAWRQLKALALERELPAHALLVEAVNDLFHKYEKPPIA
jgi:hypothetical protein